MPRTRLLSFILVICLIVVLAYLVNDVLKSNRQKAELNAQISASNATLDLLGTTTSDSDIRLEAARSEYQSALDGVSTKAVPTEVIRVLLDLSERFGFKVNPITTEQWSVRNIEKAVYRVLPINFSLDGYLDGIVKFIQTLETEDVYPYLEIENIQITPLSTTNADNTTYDSSLQIRLSIIERTTPSE